MREPTESAPAFAPWLPEDWQHPACVALPTGHHLRPIGPEDTALDMAAVMGSRERLWSIYGEAWGWPPATMTPEQDREDLQRHADETRRHESFNYALFDADETELIGCVYIDPPERAGADADISWWVRDEHVGSVVESALDELVPAWIEADWPLRSPRYVGRELTWAEWLALPGLDQ
ncbi:MAG: GNAT family N-acetyltransferase [Microbacteriaceae bacterium]